MHISRATAVLSAKLLEEKIGPMGPYDNAGQPDEVPFVVGYADEEDEEAKDEDDDGEDMDDLDDDDEDFLDHDWKEVDEDNEDEDE